MKIAFLGLGIMGRPMAASLVKAGHEVSVWNRTARQHVDGARTAVSPADAALEAEVVWICVADTAGVERVMFAADGAEQSLREGMIVVDSSTISPSATLRFAEKVNARGVHWVDAPVTGSKIGAENAQLIFIVGGAPEPVEYLQPLFKAMGKLVIHIGETSKGQSAKLCMNLMIALIYEGFAEAFTLSQKLGVDSHKLIELIQASMVRSGVVDYKAPFVLRRDYSPNFPLRLMHKDIHMMLDAAKEHRVKLPALETVDEIYELSSEEGWDDLDYAATLALLEKWAGLGGSQSSVDQRTNMPNKFGTDILIQAQDPKSAAAFYVKQLGFEITDEKPHMISLHGPHINLFIERGPSLGGPVFEVTVDNVDEAKLRLTKNGCEIVKDEPDFPRCYLKDPHGLIYNLTS